MSDYRPSSTDYNFQLKDCFLGAQILFVAFGSLVLVPLLTGLNPNVALFTAGLGTLVFQVITRGKVPIFLASSFAFIAPIQYGAKTWGIPGTMCGLAAGRRDLYHTEHPGANPGQRSYQKGTAVSGHRSGHHGHRLEAGTGGRGDGHKWK